jgi:hypothetical protein
MVEGLGKGEHGSVDGVLGAQRKDVGSYWWYRRGKVSREALVVVVGRGRRARGVNPGVACLRLVPEGC